MKLTYKRVPTHPRHHHCVHVLFESTEDMDRFAPSTAWCHENVSTAGFGNTMKWSVIRRPLTYRFENENDALMFMLRFG